MEMTKPAYAKVNLSLDIVSKMDDGYHNLKTVMQTISLCDEVKIECVQKKGRDSYGADAAAGDITVDAKLPYVPNDGRNIAAKAAAAFYRHTGISGFETKIQIEKKIPVCAGLGGGSSDAACVLRILSEMHNASTSCEELEKIGYAIGADVPFCIDGGTKLAQGRGEILTDLPPIPECYILVCKPPFSCSTSELFKHVKCKKIRARPDTDGLIKALHIGDLGDLARRMYNVFEDILPYGKKEVDSIKGMMLEYGALGAVMTGSGPSVIGLFDKKPTAQTAHEHLAQSYKECHMAVTTSGYFNEE